MAERLTWVFETLEDEDRAHWEFAIGGRYVTEHALLDKNRVRRRLLIDPRPLAAWLMSNWWRLRWEGEQQSGGIGKQSLDWRMSHYLAAAGGGLCWPSAVFSSDGEAIFCSVMATSGEHAPLRFINAIDGWVDARDFEAHMSSTIESVVERLPVHDECRELWAQIEEERQSPEASLWRALEARLGYDPDEAPASLIERLIEARGSLGAAAVDELASSAAQSPQALLDSVEQKLTGSPWCMSLEAFDRPSATGVEPSGYVPPWKRGALRASCARQALGIDRQPLDNRRFCEALGLQENIFAQSGDWSGLEAAGLRGERGTQVALMPRPVTSERFALARLLGDALESDSADQLLPVTRARTARQKFQRAFAQELLCPYEGLIEWLDTEQPDEALVEAAAAHFQVSPMVVNHTLDNHASL